MSGAVETEGSEQPTSTYDDYDVVETRNVDIEDVKFLDEVYPRESVDEAAVTRYKDALENLPPITLAEDYTLIDGLHRLRAHQQTEDVDTVTAEITNLTDSDQIFLAAVEANKSHGRQLERGDKKTAANEMKLNYRMENEEIAAVLGLSPKSVANYTSDATKQLREIRREKVLEYYLDYIRCKNQQEVADLLAKNDGIETSRKTVDRDLGHNSILGKLTEPHTLQQAVELDGDDKPDWLKWFNVWRFNGVNKEFGSDWPGRIPGQIVQNLLIHYTDRYDLVLDPMAGGGTTVDVCKAMGRRYAAFDLNPLKDKGVRKADTSEGFPVDDGMVDLVFLDPPYWNIKDDQYIEGSASAEDYDGWLDVMATMAGESERVLNSDGKAALLVMALEDETGDGQYRDLVVDCTQRFRDAGFSVEQRISAPIPTEVKSGRDVKFAKENGRLLSINRDLIIYA